MQSCSQGETLDMPELTALMPSSYALHAQIPEHSECKKCNPRFMEEETEAEGKEVSCLNSTLSRRKDEEQSPRPLSFNPAPFPLAQLILKFKTGVLF